MPLKPDEKKEIVSKMTEVGADRPCPRCGNKNFILLDGYFNTPLQNNIHGFVLGGSSVPTVGTVCTKCGYISMHAMGVLGLLK